MRDFGSTLGQVIAERRKAAHLSQEALAFKAKVHPTYISLVERGKKSPTVRVLVDIGKALGIRASELLRSAEEKATPKAKGQ